MSITRDTQEDSLQPRRGGTRWRWSNHAAPPGLGRIFGMRPCYKRAAPTELLISLNAALLQAGRFCRALGETKRIVTTNRPLL